MLRKVLKRIPLGGNKYLESGSIHDVSKWRNYRTLESNRYLGRISEDEERAWVEASKPKPAPATSTKPKSPKSAQVAESLEEVAQPE